MNERSRLDPQQNSKRVVLKSDWNGFYTREIIVFAMFFLFIPVGGGASKLLGKNALLPVMLVWGAAWLRAGFLLNTWRCPNCRKRYLKDERTTISMPFRLHCANCGVSLGYTDSPTN